VSRVGSSFTLRFGEDGVGVLGPDEWFAALVPAIDEAADGVDEFVDGVEAAAADGLYYSRSFTKGYRSWPSVADLDRQETTQSDDRGLTRAGTTRM
jgi:hypothetical protein